MNRKTLWKLAEREGVTRFIDSATAEEIEKLKSCFESAVIESEKHCGFCWYQGWEKLRRVCTHPDNPGLLYSTSVDRICSNYSYWADKETATHKLDRKEAV